MSDPSPLCGASTPALIGGSTLGPCILRARHDGRMHRDAAGSQWTPIEPPTDWQAVAQHEKGRADRAEAERDRLREAINRIRELATGWTTLDPRALYGDQDKAEILAHAGRTILAALDQPAKEDR